MYLHDSDYGCCGSLRPLLAGGRALLCILVAVTLCCTQAHGKTQAKAKTKAECVVLLHGLARTAASMKVMAATLAEEGYHVANIDYPSRKAPIESLARKAVEDGLGACPAASTVHFVTHSMGGILVRYYLANHLLERLGRVVMLAPPNKGSEAVDAMRHVPGFSWLNGPAGYQLGTDKNSVPRSLGPVDFELGIIAGTRTLNLILSQFLPNPDDGKVSVESAKVDGMQAFITVPYTHPFIMTAKEVIDESVLFLRTGHFSKQQN